MTTTFDEIELIDIVKNRILARIRKVDPLNGIKGKCWIFQGYKDKYGYGRINIKKRKECFDKNFYTHRLVYVHFKGGIKDNTEIDHDCKNRGCCNPAHLEAVTHSVNCYRKNNNKAPKGIQIELFKGGDKQ